MQTNMITPEQQARARAAHRLEIVKPGRGSWYASCSCGQQYKDNTRTGSWSTDEISKAKITELHKAHRAEVRTQRAAQLRAAKIELKATQVRLAQGNLDRALAAVEAARQGLARAETALAEATA